MTIGIPGGAIRHGVRLGTGILGMGLHGHCRGVQTGDGMSVGTGAGVRRGIPHGALIRIITMGIIALITGDPLLPVRIDLIMAIIVRHTVPVAVPAVCVQGIIPMACVRANVPATITAPVQAASATVRFRASVPAVNALVASERSVPVTLPPP